MDMGEPSGNRGGATAHPGEVHPYCNTDPLFALVSPSSMSISSGQDAEENRVPAECSSTAPALVVSLDQSDQCNPNCHGRERLGVECRVGTQARPQPRSEVEALTVGAGNQPMRRTQLLCVLGARTARALCPGSMLWTGDTVRGTMRWQKGARFAPILRRLTVVVDLWLLGPQHANLSVSTVAMHQTQKWVLGVVDGSDEGSSSLCHQNQTATSARLLMISDELLSCFAKGCSGHH
ncbi:hypothetical protein B0H17DRAFT_1132832 [Mycena rosella]|uniref:Uncharacterized protein n=1 Tax=Mycena rosella TaxID=1033263 RepID=A0AAD7DM80_MYCRO|nr:hypothetical protein B0H17DRAFT_1132832 [Mycena rosella]